MSQGWGFAAAGAAAVVGLTRLGHNPLLVHPQKGTFVAWIAVAAVILVVTLIVEANKSPSPRRG